MLGVSANLEYKKKEDFISASDYFRYMYAEANGIAFRCYIENGQFYNCKYPYRLNDKFYEKDFSGTNQYMTLNTFYVRKGQRPSRDFESIKRINALYVDIDCYKIGMSKEQVISCLHDEYFGSKIPYPTFIIDSGRGLYIIWKLRNEDRNASSKWKIVEQFLLNALIPLGADNAVCDLPRILRIPFSVNSKSNSTVTIREFNDLTYSLYDIMTEYELQQVNKKIMPATYAQKKAVWAISKGNDTIIPPDLKNRTETATWLSEYKDSIRKHSVKKTNKGKVKTSEATFMLFSLYRNELSTLMSQRKGADCKRELALFLNRLWAYEETKDAEYALEDTLKLNASFDVPFDNDYVIKVTKSSQKKIDKGQTYSYKVSTLIDLLEISDTELNKLSTWKKMIGASCDKKRDRKEANHKAYVKRLEKKGNDLKKNKITERRNTIVSYLNEGKSAEEIINILSISRATFYRDMAYLQCNKEEIGTNADDTDGKDREENSVQNSKENTITTSTNHNHPDHSGYLINGLVSLFQSISYEKDSVAVPTHPYGYVIFILSLPPP